MSLIGPNNTARPISRTELFRPRIVNLILESIPIGGGSIIPIASVSLTEVQSVNQTFEGQTGVTKGVTTPIIQMWYMGPIGVIISGRSFVGSFEDYNYNKVMADTDIEKLLVFRDKINETFLRSDEVNELRVKLEYGQSNVSDGNLLGRAVAQTLMGAIGNIDIKEADDKAFFRPYEIKFTGNFASDANVSNGATRSKSDNNFFNNLMAGGERLISGTIAKQSQL